MLWSAARLLLNLVCGQKLYEENSVLCVVVTDMRLYNLFKGKNRIDSHNNFILVTKLIEFLEELQQVYNLLKTLLFLFGEEVLILF